MMMFGATFGIIFDLENFYLPEFCSYCYKAVIRLNVVHMDVKDIWIEPAFTCCEKILCSILYFDDIPPTIFSVLF